jgi:hypothetical protein
VLCGSQLEDMCEWLMTATTKEIPWILVLYHRVRRPRGA